MSTPAKKKRITFKNKCPNPLFVSWLQQLDQQRSETSRHSFKLALNSLKKYPVVLNSGRECLILKGFGNYLCQYLDDKLREYRVEGHTTVAPLARSDNVLQNKPSASISNTSKDSLKKKYKPAYRTGPFAILITLLKSSQENNYKGYMSKEEVINQAQEYCEESFTKSKSGGLYTAWSSMSTLISKDLVKSVRKGKNQYSLTEQGIDLAFELFTQHSDAISSGIRPTVDITPLDEDIVTFSLQNSQTKPHCSNSIESSKPHCSNSIESSKPHCSNSIESAKPHCSSSIESSSSSQKSVGSIFELQPNSYDVILLVDIQETTGLTKKNDQTVLQLEKYTMIKYELRHLKVGDFTWIAKDRESGKELVLPFIVERKRMDDLASSIKDGRFHEQKHRLKKCGLPNVVYLIEKHDNDKNIGLPMASLMQAITNTRIQDNFMTHLTRNLNDSIKFLAMMTKDLADNFSCNKLTSCPKEEISNSCFDGTSLKVMTFSEFNAAASKTKPSTVKEMFIKQLLQLKGLSVEKALAIVSQYDTPSKLMNAYSKCDGKSAELMLAYVKWGFENRNLGPMMSRTLYQMFSNKMLI